MISELKHPFQRFARHVAFEVERSNPIHRRPFDVDDMRWLLATVESARLIDRQPNLVTPISTDLELLSMALENRIDGHILEFGVASGRTLRHIGAIACQTVHGFDSFEGLPENWTSDFPKGAFAQRTPEIGEHARLWQGWFDATVPQFAASDVARDGRPISLLHIDCDLYSSTRTVLFGLAHMIRPGTRIVFDEFFNYPGWRRHEYKAFREFSDEFGVTFTYVGYVPSHQQVAVEVTAATGRNT